MANGYYSRRLMGPIILITVGVLFLLDQLDSNWGFSRTWPVILIVIGAVKIFERFLASPVPRVPPPPGPGAGPGTSWQPPSTPAAEPAPQRGAGPSGNEPPKTS